MSNRLIISISSQLVLTRRRMCNAVSWISSVKMKETHTVPLPSSTTTVARTGQRSRLQVQATFVRPRYHQGLWWVRLRESLRPEDDAFRSSVRREKERERECTVVSEIIRWLPMQLVSTVKAIGRRHLLGPLSDFDLGADQRRCGYCNYFY